MVGPSLVKCPRTMADSTSRMPHTPKLYFDGRPIRLRDLLPEAALVLTVLGVAWVVAIPRLAAGSGPSRPEHTLVENLAILRGAIAQYTHDHAGLMPDPELITAQLMGYTSSSGLVSPVRDEMHPHGPYLSSVPTLPVGTWAGMTAIGTPGMLGAAWIYDSGTGRITPNTSPVERDSRGLAYADY